MKQDRLPFCSAVIVAGGSSARFGADKLFAEIHGKPVLGLTLSAFSDCEAVDEIVLVVRGEILAEAQELAERFVPEKPCRVVPGGASRDESVRAGLSAVCREAELVAVHDGARPLVTQQILLDTLWEAYRHAAAAPAVPVRDTIKIAEKGLVLSTPDRSCLFAVQTPQAFRVDILKAAHENARERGLAATDDCSVAEAFGVPVRLTEGHEENIKITTPLDLELAECILHRRAL